MGGTTPIVLLVIGFLALCVGLAGLTTGAVGFSWFKLTVVTRTTEEGLWRTCFDVNDNSACVNRDYVLEFKGISDYRERDIVLLLLICGGGFAFFALITALTMFCCQNSKSGWSCGGAMMMIFSFLGAVAGLGAVIYSEIEFEDRWKVYDHGWSVIAAYIGAVMCFLTFILSIIVLCLGPPKNHRSTYNDTPQYVGQTHQGPFYENKGYDQQNQGYQMR